METLPKQQQILLPLLEVIGDHGGAMRCADACAAVAEAMGVPQEVRQMKGSYLLSDGRRREYPLFDHRVRWVRENACRAGYFRSADRGVWQLSRRGEEVLTEAEPGVVVVVAVSDLGKILWADAISAMGVIANGSIQMAPTSPPYPLLRQRDYGGWAPATYIETLLRHLDRLKPLLSFDGSLALNLADVYNLGEPTLNTYQERIAVELEDRGWKLAGRTMWVSPCKPKMTPWVTKHRCRLANGYEVIWHWAPTSRPYLDNRNVLEPYTDRYKATLARGGEIRGASRGGARASSPGVRYAKDNGGSIPYNIITAGNGNPGRDYMQFCREQGLPLHPATMPLKVADFLVRYGSRRGDTIFEPFGGSLTTAKACEANGRQYIASERVLEYLRGGLFKLRESPGLACLLEHGDAANALSQAS